MSLRLTKNISMTVMVALALSACATVDLNEMAVPASESAAKSDVNVVERAVTKLKSAFTSKGFVAKTSRKRMQSAARVLLNGLEEKQMTSGSDQTGYAAQNKPASIVLADMSFAKRHVVQTVKAAEVYLEMAPTNRNLVEELSDLEVALMAAKEAGSTFEAALKGQSISELNSYIDAVTELRQVTDEFGARVRVKQSKKLAVRAG